MWDPQNTIVIAIVCFGGLPAWPSAAKLPAQWVQAGSCSLWQGMLSVSGGSRSFAIFSKISDCRGSSGNTFGLVFCCCLLCFVCVCVF